MSRLFTRLTKRARRLFALLKKLPKHFAKKKPVHVEGAISGTEKKVSLFPRMKYETHFGIRRHVYRRKYKRYRLAVSVIFGLVFAAIIFGFHIRADVTNVELYADTCIGGWEHPEHAAGVVDVKKDSIAFSKENSAFLANSTGELLCKDFKGDVPKDAMPQKISVKLSWLVGQTVIPEQEPFVTIPEKAVEKENVVPTDSPAVDESVGQPEETVPPVVVPESAPANNEQSLFLNALLPATARAEEVTPVEAPILEQQIQEAEPVQESGTSDTTTQETITTVDAPDAGAVNVEPEVIDATIDTDTTNTDSEVIATPPEPVVETSATAASSSDEFLEVLYTLDGETWKSAGKVSASAWQSASFTILDQGLVQWGDFSKLQVKLRTLPSIDAQPVVYLDSVFLDVEYEAIPEVHAPTVALTDASRMIAGPKNFGAGDAPTFTVTDPALSTDELTVLIENGQAKIIEDKEGVFDPLNAKSESSDMPAIPAVPAVLQEILGHAPTLSVPQLPDSQIQEPTQQEIKGEVTQPQSQPEPPVDSGTTSSPAAISTDIVSFINTVGTKLRVATDSMPGTSNISVLPTFTHATLLSTHHASFHAIKKALAEDLPVVPIPLITAEVLDARGDPTDIPATIHTVTVGDHLEQEVEVTRPSLEFRPGHYTLKVSMTTPDAIIVSQQDFTWGVLALNTDQSVYEVGDTAYLQMGVLTDEGHTVCDANLDLSIRGPSGATAHFSTDDTTIVRAQECGPDNVIDVPDYAAHYVIADGVGVYTMTLTATTNNGTKSIIDTFNVGTNIPFTVTRAGPTRIYPVVPYPMTINVTAKEDWTGAITERVPASFGITPLTSTSYDNVTTEGNTKIISWNVSLLAGQEATLGYSFNAPDISPEFYLLGKIKLTNTNSAISFEEFRNWQIASDAACNSQSGGGNWSDTSKWSCGHEPTTADAVTIVSGSDMTVNVDTQAVTKVTIDNGATLHGGTNILTIGGTTGPVFVNNGTFDAGTGTVILNGNTSMTVFSGSLTGSNKFYNLKFTPAIGSNNRAYTAGVAVDIGNNLDIIPSGITANRGHTFILSGTTTVTGTITINGTVAGASGALDTGSGLNYALSFGYLVNTFGVFNIRGSAVTVTGTTGTLITNNSSWGVPVTPSTVTLSGNGDATVVSGTAPTFFNLTSSGTGTKTLGVAITVSNVLNITGGTFAASSYTITLSGTTGTPFTNSATFSPGTGTVTYVGDNAGGSTTVLGTAYYNLTLNKNGETFIQGGAITANTVGGTFTITVGTFDTHSTNNYAITTSFLVLANTSLAVFNANASVITLNGTSGTLFIKGANGVFNVGTSEFVVTSASGSPYFVSRALTMYKVTIDADATVINNSSGVQAITMSNVDAGNKFWVKKGVYNSESTPLVGTANGTFQVDAGAAFCVGGTLGATNATCNSGASPANVYTFPTNYTNANIILATTSTIYYNSDRPGAIISSTPTYGNLTIAPTITVARAVQFVSGAVTINGNLNINPSAASALAVTLTLNTGGLSVAGSVTVQGTNSGTSTLDTLSGSNFALSAGSMSVASGSTLNIRNSTFTLTGTSGTLFTKNGTFTIGGTSTTVFSGNGSATVNSGTLAFDTLTFSGTGTKTLGAAISVASSKTMTVSAGTFDPSTFLVTGSGTNTLTVSNATIAVGASTFAGSYSAGFGTVNLNSGSTVDYNLGGIQTVDSSRTYVNLTISTSGTKSLSAATTVTGTLTVNGGTLDTVSGQGYTVGAVNLTIGASGIFRARTSAVNLTGSWSNSGTFTADTSIVTMNGGTTVSVSGTTSFYDLTITHSAAKEVDFATSGSPVYTVTHTFTATGHAAALIKLYSDATPTQWHFHPTGTASADYVDVKDSACDSGSVTVNPLTNFTNSGHNGSCWGTVDPAITFSNSDASIGFGPLVSSAVRYATGDTSGSSSDSVAHSFVIATNATNGYTLTYNGPTLTSGANTIAGGTSLGTGGTPGTAQFAISGTLTGSETGAMATNYDHATPAWTYVDNATTTLASSTGAVTSDTIDMHYEANISSLTPSGSYQTTITYILTGNF